MEGQPACFVSGVLAAVLHLSKFACAAPLRFVKQGNGWQVSVSRRCSKLGHIFISVCFILITWTTIIALQYGLSGGRNVWVVVLTLSITLVGSVVYSYEAPRRMRCLITCLNQVKKIRSELKIQWPAPWTQKQRALFVFWAISNVIINMIDSVLLMIRTRESVVSNWLIVLSILKLAMDYVILAAISQFVLITMHVQSCFRAVNEFLRNLQSDIQQSEFVEKSPYKAKHTFKHADNNFNVFKSRKRDLDAARSRLPYEAVRHVSSAYSCACDMVRAVNSVFGLMLILLLGLFLLYLVSEPYNLIIAINKRDILIRADLIIQALVQLSFGIHHVVSLVMIIEPCHMTHEEMESTRELVARLMQYTRSVCDPLTAELDQFCMQLTLNEVSYRPLYATKMTRSLVLKILSSITTYLVVLIDMQ